MCSAFLRARVVGHGAHRYRYGPDRDDDWSSLLSREFNPRLAELTNRNAGNRIVQKVLDDLGPDTFALFAEISSESLTPFEARMTELGATILHPLDS